MDLKQVQELQEFLRKQEKASKSKMHLLQTHISYVILTPKYAYKIKKPVNFGFLDFSSLEKRKYYCEQELLLNKRLSPDIYLSVSRVTKSGGSIALDIEENFEVLDYCVVMKHLPQDMIMTVLVEKGKVNAQAIKNLVEILAEFHANAETGRNISEFGSVAKIQFNTDENFAQTVQFIGKTITKKQRDFIKSRTNAFLTNTDLFRKRIKNRRIRDCHGDLHTGNIFIVGDTTIKKNIFVMDCIEFNERFRYGDVASDIATLAVDFDFLSRKDLSEALVKEYAKLSSDAGFLRILNFYKCYRAFVKGKIISFLLNDQAITIKEKKHAEEKAKKYFELAETYSKKL